MKRFILMIVISFNFLYAMNQEIPSFKIFPYFRAGFLAVKPYRADANNYSIRTQDVNYKGAVIGVGSEFLYDLKRINVGIDIGLSSVFKNTYTNLLLEKSGNNEMNEMYVFSFIDFFIAKNFYLKFGIGGHYTFIKWDWTYIYFSQTVRGLENKFFFGLLGAIGKDFPINAKSSFSMSLKVNPLFSSTDYDWGFLMPMTLNLGYKMKL